MHQEVGVLTPRWDTDTSLSTTLYMYIFNSPYYHTMYILIVQQLNRYTDYLNTNHYLRYVISIRY